MTESAQVSRLAIPESAPLDVPRHSALVRVTHWITTGAFAGLLVSGIAILLAHPRFYWGEAGAVGMPSLFDLPLPFVLVGQTGWGRYLHFLCAWICVLTGLVYALAGFFTGHFRKDLLPAKENVTWRAFADAFTDHLRLRTTRQESAAAPYNLLQRLAYSAVVFMLFPLMIWTGLAMSPAMDSVFPVLVTSLGGQQSARTIHFFTACSLLLFVAIHVGMVCISGFRDRMWGMIAGRASARSAHD
jgi:thiosulfate reductase cytochrome b subunit